MNIVDNLIPVMLTSRIIGHDHIQLASVHEHIAQQFELILHHGLIEALYAGKHAILFHFSPESKFLKNTRHKLSTPQSPLIIGSSPFETEADVVFVRPISDQRLNRAEMETKP